MPSRSIIAAASALYAAAVVSAHGHVIGATTSDGIFHQGWDPSSGMGFGNNFPTVVGWTTTVQDNGFVGKESYANSDIICHRGASNAGASIEIAAGDVLTLSWDTWPTSHHGPVMDYMASCGSAGCTTVDMTSLEFFKISEVGNVVPGPGDAGIWGADLIIQNNMQWQVQIPSNIAPGEYVLRHEILALHQLNEPQNYPQCLNLIVTGGGSQVPQGVLGTDLYTDYEDFDIYQNFDSYPIPGPPMIAGASPILDQGSGVPEAPSGGEVAEPPAATEEAEEEEVAETTTEAVATPTATATETPAATGEPVCVIKEVRKGKGRHHKKRAHARHLA